MVSGTTRFVLRYLHAQSASQSIDLFHSAVFDFVGSSARFLLPGCLLEVVASLGFVQFQQTVLPVQSLGK